MQDPIRKARPMNYVSELTDFLQEHLSWNKARLKFMARFTGALLKLTTVNFTKLALALNPKVKNASNYRRIQRFMAGFVFDFDAFGRLMLRLLPQKTGFIVCMDRTNWHFGETPINILMIAIAYKGIAFPIVWELLDKTGNSSTKERKALMRRFLQLVGPGEIQAFTADREFIGHEWFAFLKEQEVPFYIRIRKNMKVGTGEKAQAVHLFFAHLEISQGHILPGKRVVSGHRLKVVGMNYLGRENEPEHLILVTNAHAHRGLRHYRRRWEIETLFGALKSRGFDLESTHMTAQGHISKLVGLLALAFVWSHLVGQWRNRVDPLQTKKHGRLEKSLFRYGLDLLQSVMLNLAEKQESFRRCLRILTNPTQFLSCT